VRLTGIIALLCAVTCTPAIAGTPNFPKLTGPVVDLLDEVPADVERKLSADLLSFQKKTGHQLVVVTLPSLAGQEIKDYGYQLGRHWALGRKGVDDGIILIHSIKERKIRIEVGYGLEPIITDALASQIISDRIKPAFKSGNFAQGIIDGSNEIMRAAAITPQRKAESDTRLKAMQNLHAQESLALAENVIAFIVGAFALGGGAIGIWLFATRKQRAARRKYEIAAALAAQRERDARLEAARIAERNARAAAARSSQEMLDRMSPADRQAFVEREAAARRAATRAAEDAARRRRADIEARDAQAEKEYRSPPSPTVTFDSSADDYSGGGGSFGGGGADDTY